jgi:hypothetical protein
MTATNVDAVVPSERLRVGRGVGDDGITRIVIDGASPDDETAIAVTVEQAAYLIRHLGRYGAQISAETGDLTDEIRFLAAAGAFPGKRAGR